MTSFDHLQYRAEICERISESRLRAGLTQKQLAAKINSNPRTVRAWEAGVVPSADWIGLVADACDVSAEYLIGRPHGEPVCLINRRLESELLATATPTEATWNRLARLGAIADRDLTSCETSEQWATRVKKVWQHVKLRTDRRDADDDETGTGTDRSDGNGNAARRRAR